MFHFDIFLFMLSMWITIISYFDYIHVSIALQCIHTYMSYSSLSLFSKTQPTHWTNRMVQTRLGT